MSAMHGLATSIKPASKIYSSFAGIEHTLAILEEADPYLAIVGDIFSVIDLFMPDEDAQIIEMLKQVMN